MKTNQQLKPYSILPFSIFNKFLILFALCCISYKMSAQNPAQFVTATSHIGGYHIKCNGQSTGILDATPTFGSGPYTYLWNTGDTAAQIKFKQAGVYIVTATDANQVAHTDTFELIEPQLLGYQSTLSDFYGFHIGTHGGNNGSINLAASGGTPPYKYL